jgi:hypothetical protein
VSRDTATQVWTVGHSTHTLEAFVALLLARDIAQVADIRTVPTSRRLPHFDVDALAQSLPEFGVAYVHLARLGGWRHPAAGSPNVAWRNLSFRGYADYAMGEEFAGRTCAASPTGRGTTHGDDAFGGTVVAL